jgi:predicted Ser/Thr protein kinase
MSDAAPATSPAPELFVQLGALTAEGLKQCLELQQSFEKQGLALPLANVALNLGLAKPEQLAKVLAHQSTAVLRCPGCRRRFTVPDYQANRRYKCEPCKAYLEIVVDDSLQPGAAPQPAGKSAPAGPVELPFSPPAKAAAKVDPFEGKAFGDYRIVKRIAKGGMGAVYLGEDAGGRKVAIKILTEEFSRMPGIEGRFKREATTGGRLEHPNIVATDEIQREGPYTYLVMEYVDGGSLVDLIVKERRLSPAKAVPIMVDILSGLHHAHQRGVLHRDIKPGNILMTSDGRAKVIDFGLAKDAEAQTILTLAGNVVGTPAYMSPEQAKGEGATPASDQYSCGILMYLMLTGKKPFEGRGLIDTLNKQIKDPLPSVRLHNPDVTEELEKVVRRMTAKEPSQRYRSPAEAARALRKAIGLPVEPSAPELAAAPGAPAGPAPADRPIAAWEWAVLGLACVGAALLVWWATR